MISLIKWEKWRNPLRIPTPELDNTELSQEEIQARNSFGKNTPIKFIGSLNIGVMGVIPVWSDSQADDLFNFWEGHTAFKITVGDKDAIENVLGVEEFTQLTPYRFRIAIAKHPSFVPEIVKNNIEKIFENIKKNVRIR